MFRRLCEGHIAFSRQQLLFAKFTQHPNHIITTVNSSQLANIFGAEKHAAQAAAAATAHPGDAAASANAQAQAAAQKAAYANRWNRKHNVQASYS